MGTELCSVLAAQSRRHISKRGGLGYRHYSEDRRWAGITPQARILQISGGRVSQLGSCEINLRCNHRLDPRF